MKKIILPSNNFVIFDHIEHTYITQFGQELSGITSIIHRFLFPNMYAGVSSSVLTAAKNRGSEIHGALEDWYHGVAYETSSPLYPILDKFTQLVKKNKLKQIGAEYLVSDNSRVATCIDAIFTNKKGIVLVDYKTTSVLYTEYLQWQLSIEAYLFEQQTDHKIAELYAVHIPKVKDGEEPIVNLVPIDRIPDAYVEELLEAYVNGDRSYENPLHKLSDNTTELLEQYKKAELALIELNASVDYYKTIQSDIKNKIKEQMDAKATNKWENDEVTITRAKDSVRKTFKADTLYRIASDPVREWLDEHMNKCYTETTVNGNVTIKFK